MAAGGTLPTLDRIVRVGDGAETMWELTTGDTTVRVTHAELHIQARFRMAWHAHTGEMVRVKQATWDEALADWWSRAEVESAPNMDTAKYGTSLRCSVPIPKPWIWKNC